jgi:hypothetical protein
MKTLSLCTLSLALAVGLLDPYTATAAESTPWRGTLQDGGAPADGLFDMEVRLHGRHDSSKALNDAISFPAVRVNQGSFELPLDLSPALQAQTELWLELAIKGPGDSGFVTLPDRSALKSGAGACWNTRGNAGNIAGLDFLGTTDSQGLQFRVNNRPVGNYLFFGAAESPIVINGYETNITLGQGAVIAGGGSAAAPNIGYGNYATISGGRADIVGNSNSATIGATVGGGVNNQATTSNSLVAGGSANRATAVNSVVGGGFSNTASGREGTVSGGSNNTVSGQIGTIAGGDNNLAGEGSTVGGGDFNEATGALATIPGGRNNAAGGLASFAAGQNARAVHAGSFVWSDGTGPDFASTRPFQMRFRASGGLHLQGDNSLGVNAAALGNADPVELVVEAADSQINLMSDNVGTFGSVLALGEMNNGSLVNTWAIARETTGGGAGLRFSFGSNPVAASNTTRVEFNSNGTVFKSSGSASWDVVSDARMKTELGPVEHALDQLLRLRGVRFEYHSDARPHGMELPRGEQIGFIAQEVQRVFPDWVSTGEDGTLTIGERGTTALLVEALRELTLRNAALEARLSERDAELEARIAALERAAR